MKILFLHGYGSKPFQDRIDILSKYGEVHSPHLFYDKDGDQQARMIADLYEPDCIIGHSHGGQLAYRISLETMMPVLLFNPALGSKLNPNPKTYMVTGTDDKIIPANKQLNFARSTFGVSMRDVVHLVEGLDHGIPPWVFEEYTAKFFSKFFQTPVNQKLPLF